MPSLSQMYRPKRFSEVTGQSSVTETLRKEIATGMLGHAYLFSGPRGVGKTTAARIFAKALNCEAPQEGEPCNTCVHCVAANEGKYVDLIELDAATHTGVDTVRESIIEHARFSPMMGKRKVYVLDEAHMLSTSSWNALLKTLEEPPAYAFFILATTEWHKVPATIVSRCQRFEFRRIEGEVLGARLREIAEKEGWQIAPEVVRLIVSRADGCVRDAETLLGQLGSLGVSTITLETASLVIPPSHLPLAAQLLTKWADRDQTGSLQEARRLFEEGIPVLPLFDDLLEIVRRLLIATSDAKQVEAWKTGAQDEQAVVPLIGRFEPSELHDMALLLMERRRDVKGGADSLFILQLTGTAVACGLLKHSSSSKSEKGNPPPSEGGVGGGSVALRKAPEPPPAPLSPTQPMPSLGGGSDSQLTQRSEALPVVVQDATPVSIPSAPAATVPSVPEVAVAPLVASAVHAEGGAESMVDVNVVRSKWNAIITAVDQINHSIPFILKLARPERVEGDTLVIRFPYAFHRDKIITDMKHRQVVESCIRSVLDRPHLKIEGMIAEDAGAQEQRSQDMVSNILQAFGGNVIDG